jgi:hypothetical protein
VGGVPRLLPVKPQCKASARRWGREYHQLQRPQNSTLATRSPRYVLSQAAEKKQNRAFARYSSNNNNNNDSPLLSGTVAFSPTRTGTGRLRFPPPKCLASHFSSALASLFAYFSFKHGTRSAPAPTSLVLNRTRRRCQRHVAPTPVVQPPLPVSIPVKPTRPASVR